MILADKIIEERKKNGWSQEELAEKLSVSRQAVSKWESAQSTPDLQRIIKMSQIFDVSTDYLLIDEIEPQVPETIKEWQPEASSLPVVSMEEANAFLDMKREISGKIAAGVALCILSPVILLLLLGLSEGNLLPISEDAATGIGIVILLALVAIAVYVFITNGNKEKPFEYLAKEDFETAYGVHGMVRDMDSSFAGVYSGQLAIGVVLCIASAIPLLCAGMFAPDYMSIIAVSLLLCLVAAGVYLIVNVSIVKGSFDTLLQEGEYSRREKSLKKKTDPWETLYWCAATAIYLGWSFWTGRWEFTWIIWPVAGAAYGIVVALVKIFAFRGEDR